MVVIDGIVGKGSGVGIDGIVGKDSGIGIDGIVGSGSGVGIAGAVGIGGGAGGVTPSPGAVVVVHPVARTMKTIAGRMDRQKRRARGMPSHIISRQIIFFNFIQRFRKDGNMIVPGYARLGKINVTGGGNGNPYENTPIPPSPVPRALHGNAHSGCDSVFRLHPAGFPYARPRRDPAGNPDRIPFTHYRTGQCGEDRLVPRHRHLQRRAGQGTDHRARCDRDRQLRAELDPAHRRPARDKSCRRGGHYPVHRLVREHSPCLCLGMVLGRLEPAAA